MDIIRYSKKFIHYYNNTLPSLLDGVFRKYDIKNAVDLGSGDGSVLYSIFKNGYNEKLRQITAVDISKERISNVRKISDKIICVVGDVCSLDMLESDSFDLVISNQVIEHICNEEKFISEAYRILAENGLFYLSTVFKKWYGWYFYRCNGRWVLDPTHLREYSNTKQLLDMIERHNFELLEDKKVMYWFPITDFIFKRIGIRNNVYCNKFLSLLRNVKIPVIGYYNWEMLLRKKG